MNDQVMGTPFDYSDNQIPVYFEVADKKNAIIFLGQISYINNIIELEYGFEVSIAVQQIPEIVFHLTHQNIAVYAVIPRKK